MPESPIATPVYVMHEGAVPTPTPGMALLSPLAVPVAPDARQVVAAVTIHPETALLPETGGAATVGLLLTCAVAIAVAGLRRRKGNRWRVN